MEKDNWLGIFFGIFVLVAFATIIITHITSENNKRDLCEDNNLEYNYGSFCVEYVGDKVIIHNIIQIGSDWKLEVRE